MPPLAVIQDAREGIVKSCRARQLIFCSSLKKALLPSLSLTYCLSWEAMLRSPLFRTAGICYLQVLPLRIK